MNYNHLKECSVFIWGAGKRGGKLADRLEASSIPVIAFCDSNTAIIENHGIPVMNPEELKKEMNRVGNSILVIAVGPSFVLEVVKHVEKLHIYDYYTQYEILSALNEKLVENTFMKGECKCCGCNACAVACPHKSIVMKEDKEGFKYPVIDKSTCVHCGLCEKVCPLINQKHKNLERQVQVFAAMTNNEEIRANSSSGGLFTEFAEFIIKKKGIVFGAIFDQDLNVIHDYTDNVEGLQKMRGSKYVESDVKETYEIAKKFLCQDRFVLYSGTPCQIAGLYSYR